MLDFRIHTFLTVCKYMNFTKAAAVLNITQPAVSQHIRFIEKTYGVRLFTFSKKKLTLTPEGELLFQAASALKHDDVHFREQLTALKTHKKQLFFGTTLTIGECISGHLLSYYLTCYPGTEIKLFVSNTKDLLGKLDNDEIDFALVEGYFPKNKYDSMTYSKERFLCVGNEAFAGDKTEKTIPELFPYPLFLREAGSGSREILEKYLSLNNYSLDDFKLLVEGNNLSALKTMTEHSPGITFLFEIAVKEELRTGRLVEIPVSGFDIYHDFTFIWKKDSIYAPDYHKLFEQLKAVPIV